MTVCLMKDCTKEKYIIPLTQDQIDTLDRMENDMEAYSFSVALTPVQVYHTRPVGESMREPPSVPNLKSITALSLMQVSTAELKSLRDLFISVLDDRLSL